MNELLSQYLGKLLLGVAIIWAITAAVLNAPGEAPNFELEGQVQNLKTTQVKLKVREPDPNAPAEAFFISLSDLAEGSRKIFPTHKEIAKPYQPVDLEVPDSTVARAPMVLPSPGPSLPGSAKLPRWGEEMPLVPNPPKPTKGSGGNTATAPVAPVPPVKPN